MASKIKLVIWDADNTLWNGTVYYSDKEAVTIKPGTKSALKELDKRGILITMCSKNNYEDVEVMLKKFEIDKYFKEPQIGWGSKSDAIKKISKIFEISYDQMLFIDDDPFQRAEVKSQISGINITELADPIDVLDLDGIKPDNETDEDKNRVKILKQARDREEAEKSNRGDYKEFLKSCDIKLFIRKIEDRDWQRVVQLLNRTNELNATGNKYKLEELQNSYKLNNDKILVAEMTDRFGEYGLIAETIIETKETGVWFIRDLTVSCRTMGRGVGSVMVLAVLNLAKQAGVQKVKGYVKETESNWRMQDLFEKRGFVKKSDDGKIKRYEFDLNNKILDYPNWLEVTIKI